MRSILAARQRKGSAILQFKPSAKAGNENAHSSKLPGTRQAALVPLA